MVEMKVWNIYRARLIGQMMQDYGLNVIPGLQWAEPETFKFCFEGIRAWRHCSGINAGYYSR